MISGNSTDGVVIENQGTNENLVAGNKIGTDITGTVSISNGPVGVLRLGGRR